MRWDTSSFFSIQCFWYIFWSFVKILSFEKCLAKSFAHFLSDFLASYIFWTWLVRWIFWIHSILFCKLSLWCVFVFCFLFFLIFWLCRNFFLLYNSICVYLLLIAVPSDSVKNYLYNLPENYFSYTFLY